MADHTGHTQAAVLPQNRLLAKLPADAQARLRPLLTSVPLHARQVLHRQGEPIRHVYFAHGGLVSMVTVLADGALVEAATVGDGGIVGIDAFFADDAFAVCEAIVQVPVTGQTADVMRVTDFRQELARRGAFYDAIARYAQLLHAQVIRLTACNARHPVHERCARWLLTAHDHLHGEEFRLSHEFLAVMLGVRRQTVSLVAASFQSAGLIRYTHGRVIVMDRGRLEHMACECYGALRALAGRLEQ